LAINSTFASSLFITTTTSTTTTTTTTTPTTHLSISERQAYISANVVGNGLFLLVTSTTAARFRKLDVLKQVADSFSAVPAPKSSLNRQK